MQKRSSAGLTWRRSICIATALPPRAGGRLSVRTFGDTSAAADRVAYALGRALQLTNILRDIKEDAERGRIYLPREYLDAAGVSADPATILTAPGLPAVCARLAERAHAYFRD